MYWDQCLQSPQAVIWDQGADERPSISALHEYLKQHVTNILDSNADLRRTTFLCGADRTVTLQDSDNVNFGERCAEFSYASRQKRRVHLNFLGAAALSVDGAFDVSLVTQFTIDRLHMFEEIARNWEGPLVAVVYATDAEARQLVTDVRHSKPLSSRANIAYHVVYKRQYYPINQLRNIGLEQTQTPYVVCVDVDLIPMPAMYSLLKKKLQNLANDNTSPKLVPVIPAFEAFHQLDKFPRNKTELLQLWEKDSVGGYRMKRGWNLGHKATNYPKWKQTNSSYVVKWEDAFEPYVVLPLKDAPPYPEHLFERMADKIAYGLLLYAQGFDFLILPDAFVLHLPHPTSKGTSMWLTSGKYRSCGAHFFQAYKAELKSKYQDKKI